MKQTGFIEPVITPDQYIAGDLRIGSIEPVLEADSDWGEWDIMFDIQAKDFDTFNCTGFNTAQSISKILKRKYGIDFKPSPRWIGIIAGTNPSKGGNDPHVVCEAIRKHGIISDEMLPWSTDIKTVEEYYSFKGSDKNLCIDAGKKWLQNFDFKHDWVLTGVNTIEEKLNNMKVSLRYSPLGTAVDAWKTGGNGQYVRFSRDNHWTEVRGFKGDTAVVDDSYEPFEKELVPDFNFFFVKRYVINKKQTVQQLTWIELMLKWIKEQLGIIQKQVDELPKKNTLTSSSKIYLTALTYLGTDASPLDEADDKLSCAESVNTILDKAGYPIAGLKNKLSTYWSFECLLKDANWSEVHQPERGCLIISPSGYGTKRNRDGSLVISNGHMGIIGEDDVVMSSNSTKDGVFDNHWTVDTWVDYWTIKGGYPTRFFKHN